MFAKLLATIESTTELPNAATLAPIMEVINGAPKAQSDGLLDRYATMAVIVELINKDFKELFGVPGNATLTPWIFDYEDASMRMDADYREDWCHWVPKTN